MSTELVKEPIAMKRRFAWPREDAGVNERRGCKKFARKLLRQFEQAAFPISNRRVEVHQRHFLSSKKDFAPVRASNGTALNQRRRLNVIHYEEARDSRLVS